MKSAAVPARSTASAITSFIVTSNAFSRIPKGVTGKVCVCGGGGGEEG